MDERGFAVPPRKLTLSTVGILPALEKLAREPVRPNLAISLHAPDPGLRRALMPIEEKYPLDEVLDAALAYADAAGRAGDAGVRAPPRGQRHAGPRPGAGPPPRRAALQAEPHSPQPRTRDPLPGPAPRTTSTPSPGSSSRAGVTVSVRRPRGRDILAACGQLHLKDAGPGPSAGPPEPTRCASPSPSPSSLSGSSRSPSRTWERLPWSGRRSTSSTPPGPWWRAATGSCRATRASRSSTSLPSPTGSWPSPSSGSASEPGAARLVPALAAVGTLLATAWLGVLLFDRRTALAGALVLSTTLAFLSFARVAMSDMPLVLFSTLSVALGGARLAGRAPGLDGAGPRGGARARLRHQGPHRPSRARARALLLLLLRHRRRPVRAGWARRRRPSPSSSSGSAGSPSSTVGWARSRSRTSSSGEPRALRGSGLRRGSARLVLPPGLRRRGPAVVPVPSPRPVATAPPRRPRSRGAAAAPLPRRRGSPSCCVPLSLSRGKIDYYLLPLYPAVSLLVGRLFAPCPGGGSSGPGPARCSCSSSAVLAAVGGASAAAARGLARRARALSPSSRRCWG